MRAIDWGCECTAATMERCCRSTWRQRTAVRVLHSCWRLVRAIPSAKRKVKMKDESGKQKATPPFAAWGKGGKRTAVPVRVQIAGVSTLEEALALERTGADALGFTVRLPTGI